MGARLGQCIAEKNLCATKLAGGCHGNNIRYQEVEPMGFIKCPRCELNYIREEEQYCPVCKREMKGESHDDPFELCSICNENPVMPGKDVCYACYKEMNQQQGRRDDDMDDSEPTEVSLGMEDVSEMEEIALDGLGDDMPEEIGEQISLEEEKSKEAEDDEDEEEDS
jgi:hypothetical protein